jgi:hypothetical protein
MGHPRARAVIPTIQIAFVLLVILVDEKGFEPSASSLRTRKIKS